MAQPAASESRPTGEGDAPRIHRRAVFVSRIFEILALIVLVLGVLASVGILLSGFGLFGLPTNTNGVVGGIIGCALGLFVTAVYWAAITLASLVAGYIAQRSRQ